MSDNHSGNDQDETRSSRKEELWQAFRSGFAAGRDGKYYAPLRGITRRAARTEFEQFYESSMQDD